MDRPDAASPSSSAEDAGPVQASLSELLGPFRERVDQELATFLDEKLPAAEGSLSPLRAAVRDLLVAGGKRLRPGLVYHTYRACGGEVEEAVLPVALSTELLQAYLLIHDDIMDHAELRRGEPSAHAHFREHHREQEWPGDAAHFGRSAAILAGDLAHTWAAELYNRGRLAAERRGTEGLDVEALDRCFAAMCEEVIGGQYQEMLLPLRPVERPPGADELRQVLRLKSGRYSVERPIELGARLAGAPAATIAALSRYGDATGEAFQLRDDVLGTFGEEGATGKPVASDLAEGKFTFLVHDALERAPEEDRERLQEILGAGELDTDEVEAAREVMRSSGALDQVLSMIETRLADARSELDSLAFDGEAQRFFAGLIDYLRERDR